MAIIDNLPITPTGATAYGARVDSKYVRLYNNPHFDYLTEMLPRDVKDMFRWAEVVYHSTPVVVNAVRKLVNYPLTDFNYKTKSDKIREDTREFLEDILDIRSHLINLGIEYYIYGNVFRSLNMPFDRFLECPACGKRIAVRDAKYEMRRGEFLLLCSGCNSKRVAKVVDIDVDDLSRVRIVSWDPKQMDLYHNPITNDSVYYYSLTKDIMNGILSGKKLVVENLPMEFFKAMKGAKAIQFNDNIYHFKAPALSGFQTGWGISPMIPVMKLYMYIAVLRKSSEAIAMEHITPQRILYPEARSSDPSLGSSLGKWREETQKSIEMWRRDPNYVMMAPYPTGVVNIGSMGKTLMPTQEIKQAEEDIIRALDIPPEFIFGSTNLNNSPVALRMLENQLRPYVSQVTKFVNWVIKLVNTTYGRSFCDVEFTPFKLADDIMEKQLLLNLTGNSVSKSTLLEALGLKPEVEREKLVEEAIDERRAQHDVERKLTEEMQNTANQAQQDVSAAASGTVAQYNQEAMVQKADSVAQKLLTMPFEQRKSLFAELQQEDFVMYALVKARMDQMQNNGEADAIKQQSGQPTKADIKQQEAAQAAPPAQQQQA